MIERHREDRNPWQESELSMGIQELIEEYWRYEGKLEQGALVPWVKQYGFDAVEAVVRLNVPEPVGVAEHDTASPDGQLDAEAEKMYFTFKSLLDFARPQR